MVHGAKAESGKRKADSGKRKAGLPSSSFPCGLAYHNPMRQRGILAGADLCFDGIGRRHLFAIQACQADTTPAGVRKPPEAMQE